MSGYSDGVRVEHLVMHDLTDNGYECTRAASSKGVADVIAIKVGQLLLVNVKRTTMPGPTERIGLLRVASMLPGGVALVALKPLRQPLEYRLLTGPGPKDWEPWTPDEVAARPTMDEQAMTPPYGITPHEFVGRSDRWCEVCDRPDRNPIHLASVTPLPTVAAELDAAIARHPAGGGV